MSQAEQIEDRIEQVADIAAPVSRVWQALTDHTQFGEWFRVDLDGPFRVGATTTGKLTFPGVEGLPWQAMVERIEPETLFSFRWHVYDPTTHTIDTRTTLVEFRLEPVGDATRLTITESGFSKIPDPQRLEIFRGNTEGWAIQAENIAAYVA